MAVFQFDKDMKLQTKNSYWKNEPKDFESFIFHYPDILGITGLIPLARQLKTKNGRTDIICTDEDGKLYLIECKLDDNQDKKDIVPQITKYLVELQAKKYTWGDFLHDLKNNTIKIGRAHV